MWTAEGTNKKIYEWINAIKQRRVVRYDLDKVCYLDEYDRTVAYGSKNIDIKGVKEQLQGLEKEKKIYIEEAVAIINSERASEQLKYHQYEKWFKVEKVIKYIEIALILVVIVCMSIYDNLSMGIRTSLFFGLGEVLLMLLVLLIVPLAFVVAKIGKNIYRTCYNRYMGSVAARMKGLGKSFDRKSRTCYDAIDNLYLRSLDPTHRELVLLRRQQEKHNQDMLKLERERQDIEKDRLREQKRATQAAEELLSIEKEREKRYRNW